MHVLALLFFLFLLKASNMPQMMHMHVRVGLGWWRFAQQFSSEFSPGYIHNQVRGGGVSGQLYLQPSTGTSNICRSVSVVSKHVRMCYPVSACFLRAPEAQTEGGRMYVGALHNIIILL